MRPTSCSLHLNQRGTKFPCSVEGMATMKVLLIFCLVLISRHQISGFYIPPKNLCMFNNNCHQEIIKEVLQAMEAPIGAQHRNPKVPPMFFYNYSPIKPMLVKEMVDSMWKLRHALQVRKGGYNFAMSVMNKPRFS